MKLVNQIGSIDRDGLVSQRNYPLLPFLKYPRAPHATLGILADSVRLPRFLPTRPSLACLRTGAPPGRRPRAHAAPPSCSGTRPSSPSSGSTPPAHPRALSGLPIRLLPILQQETSTAPNPPGSLAFGSPSLLLRVPPRTV
jgi:hypothetical protein